MSTETPEEPVRLRRRPVLGAYFTDQFGRDWASFYTYPAHRFHCGECGAPIHSGYLRAKSDDRRCVNCVEVDEGQPDVVEEVGADAL